MGGLALSNVERTRRWFEANAESIRLHRRELHKIPELGFQEKETSAYIRRVLSSLGLPFVDGVGGTGVVARVGRGVSGRKVALRADIDGLPIREDTGLPYASRRGGFMHACGHDAHAAMLLGVAEYLASTADEIDGEILLVFQPSEERSDGKGKSGAKHVVASGLLDGAAAIVGMHVMSDSPAGKFAISDGPVMASGDMFKAVICGKGGHDAFVHETVDPVFLSTLALSGIYAIRSRKINPMDAGTISIGTVEAGTTANVVPDHLTFTGTIRAFDEAVRDTFVAELRKCVSLADTFGGRGELEIVYSVPATKNDGALAALARSVCGDMFGPESLVDRKPSMGVEDFAWYSQVCPPLFIVLGAAVGDGVQRVHHSPSFDIDDGVLYRGSALMAAVAMGALEAPDGEGGARHG